MRSVTAAIGTAFLASACCVVPLAVGFLGVGGAAAGAALEPFRPWFLALTALLLGFAFWRAYRPRDAECCDPRVTRRSRRLVWGVAVLAVGLSFFPELQAKFSRDTLGPSTAAAGERLTVPVEGMTCAGCEEHVRKELAALPGVLGVRVSYQESLAEIEFAARPDPETIRDAIHRAGYTVGGEEIPQP